MKYQKEMVDQMDIIRETQDYLIDACKEIAKSGKLYLAVGMFYVDGNNQLSNSVLVFNKEGKIEFTYRKVFLAGDEKEYLTAGKSFPIWESEYGKIGFAICWDMQFPETARSYAKQGADMVLCPTWGWEEVYGHARAYENGVYVVAAMAVPYWMDIIDLRNPSEVISPEGRVLARGSRNQAQVVYCDLPDIKDCREHRKLRISELLNAPIWKGEHIQ